MSDATNSGQLDLSLPQDGYVFTWTTSGGNWTANANAPIQSAPVNNIIFSNNQFTNYPVQIYSTPIILNGDLELDYGIEALEKTVGCSCKRCKEFNEYAEPNMPDKTFMCYACRHGI